MVERLERYASVSRRRGFTLVELMVVVAIAGVLAAVGIAALNRHIVESRSIEVTHMVQSIRAAQEQYRSVTGIYLDVSTDGGYYPREPTAANGGEKVAFFYAPGGDAPEDNDRWLRLAPTVSGTVQFGYKTRAGLPGAAIPAIEIEDLDLPTQTEPWYLIEAKGNLDGDEIESYYFAWSVNASVYSQNAGE